MKFISEAPTPLSYFGSLVQSDEHFPLLEAAVSLAQDEYPDLDVQQVLGDVDQLLARINRRLAPGAEPLERLRALSQTFYGDLGFGGNVNDYYDPDNSYLNVVLRTRRGIPISLAVLWLDLAQGLDLPASGVGFPGHFMVKVMLPKGQAVIDPFSGQSLSSEELSERLEPFRKQASAEGGGELRVGQYLKTAKPRDIIARMLRNLKEIHRAQADWPRFLAVQDRLIVLLPQAWAEYRDRGLAHAELGNAPQALSDLEMYVARSDAQIDLQSIAGRIAELRRASH